MVHRRTKKVTFDLQLFNQEKTERATPKQRRETRKKGQVARSTELTSAFLLLVTFFTLFMVFPIIFDRFMRFTTEFWTEIPHQSFALTDIHSVMVEIIIEGAIFVTPVMMAAIIVGVTSNLLQVGLLITGEPLKPKLERLDPVKGFQKIFSKRAIVELFKSLFKMVVIGVISYNFFASRMVYFPFFYEMDLMQIAREIGDAVWGLMIRIGLALVILSILDYIYQVWDHEQNIKMTKQQVKDEHKQTEGDPQVRSKIKEKQREISRKRMMSEVPEADVVITNPVHLAIALKYSGDMPAPQLVAKGQGFVAQKIKELAEANDVAVVENRELARTLYYYVEIGEEIPEELYQAVAEVLAFVYRLKRSKSME